jgi:uncharacterized protein YecE (DUF72 family)
MSAIRIGMGGWELEPFNKYFYPPRAGKGFRKLEFYSRFFDSVEVNATFYNASLSPAHARQWLEDVSANPDFVFTMKLFRGFTHTFAGTPADVHAIHRMLEPLATANKFGGLVAQFPYSFTNLAERRAYLARLGQAFRPHHLYIEVRHASWHTDATYDFLRECGLRVVNVDLPAIKRHAPLTSLAWGGTAYVRMMGRNRVTWNHPWRLEEDGRHVVSDRYYYFYSERELEQLLRLINNVRALADTVYVVFHNDPEANSLINGFQLRHLVEKSRRVSVPQNFVHTFPVLKPISTPAHSSEQPLFDAEENA